MRRWVTVPVVAIAVGGAALAWYVTSPSPAAIATGPRPGQQPANAPVPVVVGEVRLADIDIHLNGIGTVAAFNTVTIRSRVDGQVQEIAFREGQDVHAGDVLARVDPRPYRAALKQMEANRLRDQAQLMNARRDLERFQQLKEFASRQNVDTQRAQVAQLEAAVASDEAQIDNAKVQLEYCTISAPIDGRTGMRLVDAGNIVHAGDPGGIVVVTQIQPISVLFSLPEDTLPAISEEAAGRTLTVAALSRDNKSRLDLGELALVDNLIDPTTGTIKLKATFPNARRVLWPGQFVNVRLTLTTRKRALVVPVAVVQRGPLGSYAFVVGADATVEQRTVTVGPIEDGLAVIESGLAAGETVVVDGQYKLEAGRRVAPRS